MTPGARVAAAIEVLDAVQAGAAVEQALTRWARRSRFAGSKDRAAVRDHVFDVIRCKRSAAAHGGGETGRALMIGLLRMQGTAPETLFDGQGHAPAPLQPAEAAHAVPALDKGEDWDLPDWILPAFEESLGDGAAATAETLKARAPVTLRVNIAKTTLETAAAALAADGVITAPNPVSPTALSVQEGARRVRQTEVFRAGEIELQDAASQAVVDLAPDSGRVLDYCAGGGGKALAFAARGAAVFAHDADPSRMQDLPLRAARAGTPLTLLDARQLAENAPFDLVLCDAPCSGSGAWRRAPGGKWALTPERLADLTDLQDSILDAAAALVAPDGVLAYATCSVLSAENEARVTAFLDRTPGWSCTVQHRFDVGQHNDGFFTAHLTRV
ncbi:RsmB/NOP family class I SAM-dependent RNA methyltransferase [uncultured Roseobacter sp.]|uniref:RsmB/NOP family class I SAM-dependent RNA methyltransferase n=1 Tax=uncultured Roseobacter sp. TaxID=114847 RepID=UPI0026275205|nr:RsmB/NOP family class I SAM-dependent RNA methyltransferase [uncultured Roseobacter sp.]